MSGIKPCLRLAGLLLALLIHGALAHGQARVCVLADLTGVGAQDGDLFRKGAELALKETGLPYSVLDTQSSPQGAVTAASRALNQERCTALVGPGRSTTMRAVIPLLKESREAVAFTMATGVILTEEGQPYLYRVAASDATASQAFARVVLELGARRLAVIYSNDAFGRGLYELFRAALGDRGVFVAAESYTSGTRDFTPQLLKGQGADLLVAFSTFSEDAAALARQYRELGLEMPVLANKAFVTTATLRLAGRDLDRFWVITDFYEEANPQAVRFGGAFRSAYGQAADVNAAGGYDSVRIYGEALKLSKGDAKFAKIRQALLSLKNYQAVAGKLSYRLNGEGIFELSLLRLEGAQPHFLKVVEVNEEDR